MSWINLSALWKIIVFGLIAGAGLPALFAGGLYALSWGPRSGKLATAGADGGDGSRGGAGRGSGRSVAQGAASVVWAVTLPNGGPTGTFTRDGRELPW